MKKRRGNSNWGKSSFVGPATELDAWDAWLASMHIDTADKERIRRSTRIREFARTNANRRYVPEWLLDEMGISPVVTYD